MKAPLTLVASALAAAALTSAGDRDIASNPSPDYQVKQVEYSMKKDKYAPKMDGLRFIETLITAHR